MVFRQKYNYFGKSTIPIVFRGGQNTHLSPHITKNPQNKKRKTSVYLLNVSQLNVYYKNRNAPQDAAEGPKRCQKVQNRNRTCLHI